MARLITGVLALCLVGTGFFVQAESTPTPTSEAAAEQKDGSPEKGERGERGERRRPDPAQIEKSRLALEKMTKEEREKFKENLRLWSQMSPEQRATLFDREEMRKRWMRAEIDKTVKELGLNLNEEQRKAFGVQYAQGRRKIEEGIRKEMEEKRRPLVQELKEKLKQDFSNPAAVAGTPQPGETASGTIPGAEQK